MSRTLRRAVPADLAGILALKADLRLREAAASAGGFLLGTSAETYAYWIMNASFWVVDSTNGVSGFAIGLADEALRASEIWMRRRELDADAALLATLENAKLGYFEQLAVARNAASRRFAALLALRVGEDLFDAGHEYIVTTTVREPVTNRAAWPFLRRVHATQIGMIDEIYPGIGPVRSDVHVICATGFRLGASAFAASRAGSRMGRKQNLQQLL